MILDLSMQAHQAADARLRQEPIAWLTTVNPSGQPQSTPIWFLWDGDEFLIYGSKSGPKTSNIRANPHVSLHLEGNRSGGDNVIFEGTAGVDGSGTGPCDVAGYLAQHGGATPPHRGAPGG